MWTRGNLIPIDSFKGKDFFLVRHQCHVCRSMNCIKFYENSYWFWMKHYDFIIEHKEILFCSCDGKDYLDLKISTHEREYLKIEIAPERTNFSNPNNFDQIEYSLDESDDDDSLEYLLELDLEEFDDVPVLLKSGIVEFNKKEYQFNPNDIKIDFVYQSVSAMIDFYKNRELILEPSKEAKDWNREKQSQFIESVILGLPTTPLYFDEYTYYRRVVIDGNNRMYAMVRFLEDEHFVLEGLAFLKQFNGYNFKELPAELQRQFRLYKMPVYIFLQGMAAELKYTIASRLDENPPAIEKHSIYNLLKQGEVYEFITNLSRHLYLRNEEFSRNFKKEGSLWDYTALFLSFYINGTDEYNSNLGDFISKCYSNFHYLSSNQRTKIELDFKFVYSVIDDLLIENARNRENISWNKNNFLILSCCLAKLDDRQQNIILSNFREFSSQLHKHLSHPFFEIRSSRKFLAKPEFDLKINQLSQFLNLFL